MRKIFMLLCDCRSSTACRERAAWRRSGNPATNVLAIDYERGIKHFVKQLEAVTDLT
jgi:hypothetical protein